MKRSLGITLLVLVVWLGAPVPASAGLWAWLEEWSGPGPFSGYTFLFTACVQDRTLKASPISRDDTFHVQQHELAEQMQAAMAGGSETTAVFRRLLANPDPEALRSRLRLLHSFTSRAATKTQPAEGEPNAERITEPETLKLYNESPADHGPGHRDPRLICGYVDQGFFHAPENAARGFGKISAHLTDIGPSARIHDGVDIGAGIGWVTFSGERVNVPAHFTITPIRLILRPITLAIPEERRARWMGVLNIYWKETYVKGRLSAEQFGSTTDTFSVNGELIRSFGFNVDITALFPAKWRFH